jgi:hypothetical protein
VYIGNVRLCIYRQHQHSIFLFLRTLVSFLRRKPTFMGLTWQIGRLVLLCGGRTATIRCAVVLRLNSLVVEDLIALTGVF